MDSVTIFGAKYLFVAVVLIYILIWAQANKKIRIELIASAITSGIIAAIADKIGGKLYYDPRPFVSHHLHPLIAHAADNGFPSEHTLFSMTLASVIFFYRPRWGILAMVIALL